MSWLREAISDEAGQADMAYVSIGAIGVAGIAAVIFIFAMSAVDYDACVRTPITTVSKGDQSTTNVIPCRFDPLPLGQATGLIFGGFATLIASLAGYMAATKKGPRVPAPQPQPPAPAVQGMG